MLSANYTPLDLTGVDLNESDPQTVAGIRDKFVAAVKVGAPIILVGLVNDGAHLAPVFSQVIVDAGILQIIGYDLALDADTDTVTVSAGDSGE